MKIEIEKGSGFCFGVRTVIQMAEEILDKGNKLYCLGEIVHNEEEVNRLEKKGMCFITMEDLLKLENVTVLIRAHGEPPSTYQVCEERKINVIDGTCPIVKALQKKIKNNFKETDPINHQIVIYGKEHHPEVIGLNGQIENSAIIVRYPEELDGEKLRNNVSLFSQTTMDSDGFAAIEKKLSDIQRKKGNSELESNNTICKHISHRQPGIEDFARSHEVLIFVAGKHSSNGKILYEICRKQNNQCKFISEVDELDKSWFTDIVNIGITGATSTPGWLLEAVRDKIKELLKN